MVDAETGEWRNERAGHPLLAAVLRRPANAMWGCCDAARASRGDRRWRPQISEFQEAAGGVDDMAGPAAALLRTNAPAADAGGALLHSAGQALAELGAAPAELPLVRQRPSTAERRGGRTPLTVLKPAVAAGVVQPLPPAPVPVRASPVCRSV